MSTLAYIIQPARNLTVFDPATGRSVSANADHPKFDEAAELLKTGSADADAIFDLLSQWLRDSR